MYLLYVYQSCYFNLFIYYLVFLFCFVLFFSDLFHEILFYCFIIGYGIEDPPILWPYKDSVNDSQVKGCRRLVI